MFFFFFLERLSWVGLVAVMGMECGGGGKTRGSSPNLQKISATFVVIL